VMLSNDALGRPLASQGGAARKVGAIK
jgi:hypothetical protein